MRPGSSKPNRAAAAKIAAPRAGRPSRDAALLLRERILDVATELLFTHGYGATSIEAIARRARVSKRTFYQRFPDKPALITAVVGRLIDNLRPPADIPLIEGEGLEQILVHLGSLILRAALTPRVLQLQRLIVAESGRFPDLAAAVAKAGGRKEAVAIISELLMRDAGGTTLSPAQAGFAAHQFLQMIVSLPQLRAIGLGASMTPGELDAWVRDTVALFLDGAAGIAKRSSPD
ncbi:MAG TPA: TetR/AcrR family transcriptional regulator [Burkholderiaceae bacterium]|nr:TetR/AcrR family transcriptional regulator [Burkholderiaceae bacterium]